MRSSQDSIEELLCEESQAIEAIAANMKITFNAQLKYKALKSEFRAARKKSDGMSSQDFTAFWNECTNSFKEYIDNFNSDPDIQEIYDVDPDDIEEDDVIDVENNSEVNDCVSWYDSIDQLKACYYQVEEDFLRKSPQHQNCNKLFSELCRKIEEAKKVEKPTRKIEFGRYDFDCLEKVINLQNQYIRELLPYLLTAYTFNFWRSRFFYRGSKLLDQVFNASDIEAIDAPKIRGRIDKFSKIFGLNLYIDGLISKSDDDRPSLDIPISVDMKETPHIRYRALLNGVFSQWCTIVTDWANKLEIDELAQNINIAKCEALYRYYTKQS